MVNKRSSRQVRKVIPQKSRYYDQITGLPNRTFFMENLDSNIKKSKNDSSKFALLFININKFHKVNANYGHAIGDKLLNKFASMLNRASRKLECVAKVGDDEFVVIIQNIISDATVVDVANRVLDLFKLPLQIDEYSINLEISIGISIYPESGLTKDQLLNNAVCALQRAKSIDGSVYAFYSRKFDSKDTEAIEIGSSLIDAISNNEFNLVYQPIIDVVNKKIATFEVLLRWNSKHLGVIDPDIFVQVAERQGIMASIGEWVFNQALEEYAKWIKSYPSLEIPVMSINSSVIHFKNKSFFKNILQQLKDLNISNDKLTIEITETMIFDDKNSIHAQIKDLYSNNPKKRSCKNLSPLELKRCILGLLSVKSKSTQLLLYR